VRAVHTTAGGVAASALLTVVVIYRATPQKPIEAGRAAYMESCANCHGDAATGFGPAAALLRQQPPDLTRYSNRTTPFPRESLRNAISGRIRLEPSHGPSEMPRFRTALEPLLDYLEYLQAQPFGAPVVTSRDLAAAGATLFAAHCTPCHGEGGRGPDLSLLSQRHAGFDVARVKELIARYQQKDDDEMPGWWHSFRRAGWNDAVTNANITALAHYLESIQRH
jgi:mono/diheme cytochrome c family protein